MSVPINYAGADGIGWSGKFIKITSRKFRNLVDSGFQNITSLSFATCSTDAPAFHRTVYLSLGILLEECQLFIVFNNDVIKFKSREFYAMEELCLTLFDWCYGQAFSDLVSRNPDLHLMSASNGKLSPTEQRALNQWYQSPVKARAITCRWVYPWNLVNEKQLGQLVQNETLKDFILRGNGKLRPTSSGYLSIWEVEESDLGRIRNALSGTKATIVNL